MIAHLGMYSHSDLNAAFWMRIRIRLGYGPDYLTEASDYWSIWQNPDLLFSQTCGYPYRARLHGTVELVGTPDYGLADCKPGHYFSVVLARNDDRRTHLAEFDGACLAFNEALSQSGWAGPMHLFQSIGLKPGSLLESGSHAASINAIINGGADFAGIDAVTWELIQRSGMNLSEKLRVIARTDPTPGLPYITGIKQNAGAIATAVEAAIDDLPEPTRFALHLRGLARIPAAEYLDVPTPPPPAEVAPITHA